MSETTKKAILRLIKLIRQLCDQLEEIIEKESPPKEWLSTKEFAEKENLELKTVSNYCGMGKFDRIRKNEKGFWEIHRSECSTK